MAKYVYHIKKIIVINTKWVTRIQVWEQGLIHFHTSSRQLHSQFVVPANKIGQLTILNWFALYAQVAIV